MSRRGKCYGLVPKKWTRPAAMAHTLHYAILLHCYWTLACAHGDHYLMHDIFIHNVYAAKSTWDNQHEFYMHCE